jgi:DNA-binding MarR family transcriptional regulator
MLKPNTRLAANKFPRVDTMDLKSAETLDLTALQQTPGFMIRILQIQIFAEFFEYFSPVGLSPAEHSSLITIRDNPSVTQSEIASVLRIQPPNLVKILLKLETNGLIKRKRSNRDKRAVELTLTSSGERAAFQASKMADAFNRLTLSPLSESEQKQFIRMLSRLVDARTNKHDRAT